MRVTQVIYFPFFINIIINIININSYFKLKSGIYHIVNFFNLIFNFKFKFKFQFVDTTYI